MTKFDRFNQFWLFETPLSTGISAYDPYTDLVKILQYNIDNHNTVQNLGDNLYKLDLNEFVTYWIEKNNQIEIIANFHKVNSGLYVELIGKRPNSSEYASDFYQKILKDGRIIFSGDQISDQAIKVWKRLVDQGSKIFIYNKNNPTNKLPVQNADDLSKFLGQTQEYKDYRFVLTENAQQMSIIVSDFEIMRIFHLTHGYTI